MQKLLQIVLCSIFFLSVIGEKTGKLSSEENEDRRLNCGKNEGWLKTYTYGNGELYYYMIASRYIVAEIFDTWISATAQSLIEGRSDNETRGVKVPEMPPNSLLPFKVHNAWLIGRPHMFGGLVVVEIDDEGPSDVLCMPSQNVSLGEKMHYIKHSNPSGPFDELAERYCVAAECTPDKNVSDFYGCCNTIGETYNQGQTRFANRNGLWELVAQSADNYPDQYTYLPMMDRMDELCELTGICEIKEPATPERTYYDDRVAYDEEPTEEEHLIEEKEEVNKTLKNKNKKYDFVLHINTSMAHGITVLVMIALFGLL